MASSDAEVIVAVVALIISVVALFGTFMQVMQQYYSSAFGYAECNEKVMGEWASTRSRRFSWHELRYEVEFDAPVIFVAKPTNKHGPVKDAPIYYLDGDKAKMKENWTDAEVESNPETKNMSLKEKIHTADNERASWYVLLSAIQRMEADSREWQEKEYSNKPPRDGLQSKAPDLLSAHTFTVAVQRKRKSWDTMARSVARPYATTTICHLVEMMAALGIYWKEFDRRRDRYRAEGNGFMVLGERLSDLGLCFNFSKYGKCRFGANRIIPNDEIKELCFGYVPTVYRETNDERRLDFPDDTLETLGSLKLGSRGEIADTLGLIGCNNDTVRYFSTEYPSVTSHLFPISFELLGMLGRTFYIDDTCFTYLPNPTSDRWDKRSVNLVKLLQAFRQQFKSDPEEPDERNPRVVRVINKHIDTILGQYVKQDQVDKLVAFKALRAALRDCNEVLVGHGDKQSERWEAVRDVLRAHLQEVLRLLNEADDSLSRLLVVPASNPPSPMVQPLGLPIRAQGTLFRDMNSASPSEKQHKFMKVYFENVRPKVINKDNEPGVPGYLLPSEPASPIASVDTDSDGLPDDGDAQEKEEKKGKSEETKRSIAEEEVSHDDIWCTLVFKMICWLTLHDFHKMDVQIQKSELMGSRMPVYIS